MRNMKGARNGNSGNKDAAGDGTSGKKRSPPATETDTSEKNKRARFHNALEARIRENPTGADDVTFA